MQLYSSLKAQNRYKLQFTSQNTHLSMLHVCKIESKHTDAIAMATRG